MTCLYIANLRKLSDLEPFSVVSHLSVLVGEVPKKLKGFTLLFPSIHYLSVYFSFDTYNQTSSIYEQYPHHINSCLLKIRLNREKHLHLSNFLSGNN